ncbi:MAG: oxidoreductase [Rhodocyclales bacterium]|nr:oxidoreductase [Rhodocyclales bacterium]
MKKWNLVIDVALCENCNNCALATKDEHIGNDFPGYAAPQPRHGHHWIEIKRRIRGSDPMVDVAYLPTTCNHCDAAPCIVAARDETIRKRSDGIVIIDPLKAKGRRDLVHSCPYGAIWWNEELQLPQKWIFEVHLLDQGWRQPRGVQACPTGAMRSFHLDDEAMQAMALREGLETLHPEWRTKPRVYYRNLHRYAKCFIGGSVTVVREGVPDCLAGAKAVLRAGDKPIAEAATDVFGDFKFDALAADGTSYLVEVSHPEFGAAQQAVELRDQSIYLGEIRLGGNRELFLGGMK